MRSSPDGSNQTIILIRTWSQMTFSSRSCRDIFPFVIESSLVLDFQQLQMIICHGETFFGEDRGRRLKATKENRFQCRINQTEIVNSRNIFSTKLNFLGSEYSLDNPSSPLDFFLYSLDSFQWIALLLIFCSVISMSSPFAIWMKMKRPLEDDVLISDHFFEVELECLWRSFLWLDFD